VERRRCEWNLEAPPKVQPPRDDDHHRELGLNRYDVVRERRRCVVREREDRDELGLADLQRATGKLRLEVEQGA
jgi:hypothetical protein